MLCESDGAVGTLVPISMWIPSPESAPHGARTVHPSAIHPFHGMPQATSAQQRTAGGLTRSQEVYTPMARGCQRVDRAKTRQTWPKAGEGEGAWAWNAQRARGAGMPPLAASLPTASNAVAIPHHHLEPLARFAASSSLVAEIAGQCLPHYRQVALHMDLGPRGIGGTVTDHTARLGQVDHGILLAGHPQPPQAAI